MPLLLASLLGCPVDFGDKDEEDEEEAAAHAVLVLLDASSSMVEEGAALAAVDLPTLLPAEWRLGLTTLSVDYDDGATTGIDPGEVGTLAFPSGAIAWDDADGSAAFRFGVLCQATCWDSSDLADDPTFTCTDPAAPVPAAGVSTDYLDCVCGADVWQGNCGSGTEEGLESLAMTQCLGLESPPESCDRYADPDSGESAQTPFAEAAGVGTHDLFDGADDLYVLVISDEGDGSRRVANGDPDPQAYLDLFDTLGLDPTVSMIGPAYDATTGDGSCLAGAYPSTVERYQRVVDATGGEYLTLTTTDTCEGIDLETSILTWAARIR